MSMNLNLLVALSFFGNWNQPEPAPSPDLVTARRAVAVEARLTPTMLAAVGITPATATRAMTDIASAEQARASLRTAEANLQSTLRSEANLERQLFAAPGDPALLEQRRAIRTEKSQRRAQVISARSTLQSTVGGTLMVQRGQALAECASARVPAAVAFAPTTSAQRRAIAAALIAERRAVRMGGTASDTSRAVLQQLRANSDYAAAAQRVGDNAALISAAMRR